MTIPLLLSHPDGTTKIELKGFDRRDARPGVPDLPFRIVRIAIPPGVVPRLEVGVLEDDLVPGVLPRAIPRRSLTVPPESVAALDGGPVDERIRRDIVTEESFQPDESVYRGLMTWPETVASIVEEGVFRDQRYVDVRVNPVRFDPAIDGLRAARSVEITVYFDGDAAPRRPLAAPSRFEDVYRKMFANYEQGTTFRLSGPDSAPAVATATLSAAFVGGPVEKIKIRQNAVVRLDATRMTGTGFAALPLSTWKLSNRGVEVPLEILDVNGNDLLDASDWVEFYGQALDDEPKAVLNTDIAGSPQDIFEITDYTDENVYFLTSLVGVRARMAVRDAAPTNTRIPPPDFEATAHVEQDTAWRPLNGNDPWYWGPAYASTVAPTFRTDVVPLPGLTSGTSPVRVIEVIRGISEDAVLTPDHRSRVSLSTSSGQLLASNDDNGTFDGRTIYTHDFTWTYPGTGAVATDPVQVKMDARPIAFGLHEIMLNYVEVKYRRNFQASGDALRFDWPDGDSEFALTNLTSAVPEVWELTGRVGNTGVVSTVRVTGGTVSGAGPYSVRFRMDDDPLLVNGTMRRFVVFGGTSVAVPANPDFVADTVSDLRNNAIQADMIVIAHPTVLGALSQPTLTQLLNWHSANQGITSKIAMIDDVYDEFNDGLPGPEAIRRFLRWAMSTTPGEGWANPKPSYVLILGDGSYDYKAGTVNGNFVPTAIMIKDDPSYAAYASESSLAAVVGTDKMPDLSVGRISVRSDAECNGVLQKILNYEQNPPTGNWRAHALVISDRGKNYDTNESDEFEGTNELALADLKRPPHTSRRLRYWSDYCNGLPNGCTQQKASQFRSDVKAAVNGTDGVSDGASIIQYIGHGSFDVWSDDAIFDDRDDAGGGFPPPGRDSDGLTNATKPPLLLIHNCLNGGFMNPSAHTLGEDWMNKSDGGSIGLFAPSGLSYGYDGQVASDLIWGDFFGKAKSRELAVPVMDVYADRCSIGAVEACQTYVLMGDPALRLVFPTVAVPTNVIATPGNARVDLGWTASATPGAKYDVYRSAPDQPASTYTKISGATPFSGTSFADTGLTNAKTYYYYVVALDASGFESRWSHLSSDCGSFGPDCLFAKPLNPNPPPAPLGLVVSDPETGGKLNLNWTPSPPADELKSYEVRWGTVFGTYPNAHNTGKNAFDSIGGLVNGQTYYFAVTAMNTSDVVSSATLASGVPSFVRGVRAPQFVATLHVDKSGADAVVTWSPVTTDIYGKAATIASYEIYRGTSPTFIPAPGNRIGTPASALFTDPNALSGVNPNYYYLVRALDASGNAGGLGNQLPNGIDVLTSGKTPDGLGGYNVSLSWPAVTMDFDQLFPVAIAKYEAYGTDHPFTRADIKNGLVPLLASPTTNSWTAAAPAFNRYYYSVIAVDVRGNKSPF